MNHALLLTKNCLDLTKRCVDSLRAQDIPVKIHVYDNESTDQTKNWLEEQSDIIDHSYGVDIGVSAGWNFVLDSLFSTSDPAHGWHADQVLCVNNDTILPHWFLRESLQYLGESHWRPLGDHTPVEFVTGVSVGNMDQIAMPAERRLLVPHPDFSGFLIMRSAWEKIGPFDENLVLYCGDLDYHIRAHRAGLRLWNAGIPFMHDRSSTMNSAAPKEKRFIQLQADADRVAFADKWGCATSGPAYDAMFDEALFGVDRGTIIP